MTTTGIKAGDQVWGLNKQKNGNTINSDGQECWRKRSWGTLEAQFYRTLHSKCLLDMRVKTLNGQVPINMDIEIFYVWFKVFYRS